MGAASDAGRSAGCKLRRRQLWFVAALRVGRLTRWLAVLVLLAGALSLSTPAPAEARHGAELEQTNDFFGGIGLKAQVRDPDALVNRHPLNSYRLDANVDAGPTDIKGHVESALHGLAGVVWDVTRLLTAYTIALFTWAFSFDLLEVGGAGVAAAMAQLYSVVGREFMTLAIVMAGLWGIWRALVQRRYTETAGALGLSVVFAVVAAFLTWNPGVLTGQVSSASNGASEQILSVLSAGPAPAGGVGPIRPGDAEDSKRVVADRLFETFVYDPWVVLNFGGLEHCVSGSAEKPRPAERGGAGARCINHKHAAGGRGGYAEHWLNRAPGTEARRAEYVALNLGEKPTGGGIFASCDKVADAVGQVPGVGMAAGVLGNAICGDSPPKPAPGQFNAARVITPDDEPAVDIQQAGQAGDRLALAGLIFVANLGLVFLLGALSLGVFLAQVLVLLLLAFAPIALVFGIVPGGGHDFFRTWLRRLGTAALLKIFYSLVLAVTLAVSAALATATEGRSWGAAFAFQAAFMWMVFLLRNKLWEHATGQRAEAGETLKQAYYTKRMASGPLTAPFRAATLVSGGAVAGAVVANRRGEQRRSVATQAAAEAAQLQEARQRSWGQNLHDRADESLRRAYGAQRNRHDEQGKDLSELARLRAQPREQGDPRAERRLAQLQERYGPDEEQAHQREGERLAELERLDNETGRPYSLDQFRRETAAIDERDRARGEPPAAADLGGPLPGTLAAGFAAARAPEGEDPSASPSGASGVGAAQAAHGATGNGTSARNGAGAGAEREVAPRPSGPSRREQRRGPSELNAERAWFESELPPYRGAGAGRDRGSARRSGAKARDAGRGGAPPPSSPSGPGRLPDWLRRRRPPGGEG